MTDSLAPVRSELAPTGTLRVALNMSNFLLTATDPVTGEPCGIAADLGRELGQRLGVPVPSSPTPILGRWPMRPQRVYGMSGSSAPSPSARTRLTSPRPMWRSRPPTWCRPARR